MASQVTLFSGSASTVLAGKIAAAYGIELGKVTVQKFADGEIQPCFEENIRGRDVFIVQSTYTPAENILELLMMIDAARRASAKTIVAIIPYFGYARQDRKDKPRVSIAAKLMANLLSAAGVNRLITIDLHADQIQGFFDFPVDHLFASSVFIPYLKSLHLRKLTFASPDTGGTRRAGSYAKFFETDFVICYKHREKPNVIGKMALVGDVKGKDVILLDDIIDTGGTLCKAAALIKENGANSVRAMVTHPLFSKDALKDVEASALDEVVTTDTIPLLHESPKVRVVTAADLLAQVIDRLKKKESINSLFKF